MAKELKEKLLTAIEEIPESNLGELLDFMEFLLEKEVWPFLEIFFKSINDIFAYKYCVFTKLAPVNNLTLGQ